MKTIKVFLTESLIKGKKFDFKAFEKAIGDVEKVTRSKSSFTKWYKAYFEDNGASELYNGVQTIVNYFDGFKEMVEDSYLDWEDEYAEEYGSYDNIEFVENYWNGLWASLSDDLGPEAEPAFECFLELWNDTTKEEFPFSMN